MVSFQNQENNKWSTLAVELAKTLEPIKSTPTEISPSATTVLKPGSTSTESVISIVDCPWSLTAPEFTEKFQFTCPDQLVLTSGAGKLFKYSG